MNIFYIIQGKKAESKLMAELLKDLYKELCDEARSARFNNDIYLIELLDSGKTEIYVAKLADSSIVGITTLTRCQTVNPQGEYGLIREIYVRPVVRSMSIGKKMVEKVVAVARERKWKFIEITAPAEQLREKSLQFYKGCGFTFDGVKLKYTLKV